MKEIHDGAQLYAVIHSIYHPQERIWDTHPFITMFSYLKEADVRLFCDEEQHLFSERNGKTSPALLQGMLDMCQARITAALKQSKQNSYEANCLEDDLSDIETIRDVYLPLENAIVAAQTNTDYFAQALECDQANKHEKDNKNEQEEHEDYDYLNEPSIPVWMLF